MLVRGHSGPHRQQIIPPPDSEVSAGKLAKEDTDIRVATADASGAARGQEGAAVIPTQTEFLLTTTR